MCVGGCEVRAAVTGPARASATPEGTRAAAQTVHTTDGLPALPFLMNPMHVTAPRMYTVPHTSRLRLAAARQGPEGQEGEARQAGRRQQAPQLPCLAIQVTNNSCCPCPALAAGGGRAVVAAEHWAWGSGERSHRSPERYRASDLWKSVVPLGYASRKVSVATKICEGEMPGWCGGYWVRQGRLLAAGLAGLGGLEVASSNFQHKHWH